MNRRSFVRTGAVAVATISAPWLWVRRANAAGWGELPTDTRYWPATLPRREYKVLELHLAGGLSHYETFYVMSQLGAIGQWFGFSTEVGLVDWSNCGANGPTTPTETQPFSGPIHLGPATKPLWQFRDQMRVIVLEHEDDLEPHELAIPVSLTGLRPGNPKFAGLGAAIEHRADSSRPARPQPFSYVLMPANLSIDEDSFQGIHATGLHGGQFRPLLIRIPVLPAGQSSVLDQPFLDSLSRSTGLINNNSLLRQYAAQYRDRLRHTALPGTPARSSEFAAYEAALDGLLNAPHLRSTLQSALQPVQNTSSCVDGASTPNGNLPAAAVRTAARLLALDEAAGGARYVGVVDGGIRLTSGGGYDVHGINNYPAMFTNLWNTLSELAAVMHRPTAGQTPDPTKINLNDTIVFLNTEFGRTPTPGTQSGRDHWPKGYVTVLIGGPLAPGAASTAGVAGVGGELDSGGLPVVRSTGPSLVHPYTAADVHAALLIAAGIDPFDERNFGVGDVGGGVRADGGGTEEGVAQAIRTQILGF
jgi:hypothetical protein